MAVQSRVDENGKVTLPYAVRKLLGLQIGGRVQFTVDEKNGTVTLTSGAATSLNGDDRFSDLAHETQAQRMAAARGLAALRGGVVSSENEF